MPIMAAEKITNVRPRQQSMRMDVPKPGHLSADRAGHGNGYMFRMEDHLKTLYGVLREVRAGQSLY